MLDKKEPLSELQLLGYRLLFVYQLYLKCHSLPSNHTCDGSSNGNNHFKNHLPIRFLHSDSFDFHSQLLLFSSPYPSGFSSSPPSPELSPDPPSEPPPAGTFDRPFR